MIPGARVALNQDNLSVIEVLSDSWDPLVVTSEIIEKPSVTFDDVGGLEEQIIQIREAVELSFTNRDDFERFSIDPPKESVNWSSRHWKDYVGQSCCKLN